MSDPFESLTDAPDRITEVITHSLAKRTSRRNFLVRIVAVGSAISLAPLRFLVRPAGAVVEGGGCTKWCGHGCSSPDLCCDGFTTFCCTITGDNVGCPNGCIVGGYWYAYVGTTYCNSQPYPGRRYYIDCVGCCSSCCCCRCSYNSCGNRETCCHYSNYGQCNGPGTVRCRLVRCLNPCRIGESQFASCGCDDTTADQSTCCHASSASGCTFSAPSCTSCGGTP